MSKTGIFLLTLLVAFTTATAQPKHGKNHDRIKALKIAFITEKLDLNSSQAEKFWPVYNRYEREKWELRKSFINKYKTDNPASTPMAAHEYIEANLEYQEQELDIKKKYKDELLKAITAEQLAELYKAERGFKQLLLKELGDRRGGQPNNKPDR